MSEPKNHHYVPQCLIKNFINSKGQYSCYDKIKNNHYYSGSSKSIFSEKELNTIVDDEGNLNHSEIESQLNKKFESEFPKHYNLLKGLKEDENYEYLDEISKNGKLKSALYYLIRLGLIGDFRNPNYLKKTDLIIENIFNTLKINATTSLSNEIDNQIEKRSLSKYNSHSDLEELADGIIKNMGEHVFTIHIAPENEFFILPDCQSTYQRNILEDDVIIDGLEHKSMCNVVSILGYPIDSRMFLSIESKKISIEKFNMIKKIDSNTLFYLNYHLYKSAYKDIICENENYLKALVDKLIKFDKIVSKQ